MPRTRSITENERLTQVKRGEDMEEKPEGSG